MKEVYILFKVITWADNITEIVAVYDNELDCEDNFNRLMKDYNSFLDTDFYYWESYKINEINIDLIRLV